jgi:uncharacterized delta-60 repeat protein
MATRTRRNIGGTSRALEMLERRLLLAAAGELDTSFSGDGRAPLPFGPGVLVGVQPDGKIVHTRVEDDGIRLGRLNANGTNDTSFLGGQTLTQDGGTTQRWFDMQKTSGRIAMVASDTSPADDTRVAVFKADGSPDGNFDGDGIADLDLNYVATRIAWQGDKLIILGGPIIDPNAFEPQFSTAELRRINANGTLDTTFGNGGKVTLPGTAITHAELVIGPNGQINVALDRRSTDADFNVTTTLSVHRFTVNGQSDTTFGGGAGFITVDSGLNEFNMALLAFTVGEDGGIYHLARSDAGIQFRRFTADGALVATSGALEYGVPNWMSGYYPNQLGLQPDGKVLAIGVGPPADSIPPTWTIVRLYPDGQIDTTYGAGGVAQPRFEYGQRALVQGDGKVLVAGDRVGPDGPEVGRIDSGELNVGVIRLNRKGTLLVYGTSLGENLSVGIRGRDGKFIARVGNLAVGFAPSKIKRIAIFAGAGNDVVTIGNGVKGAYAQGDDGADILNGGAGDDVLVGGLQPDQIFGFDGNDKLAGEGGNDYLLGGAGKDDLFGQGGRDTLSGAGGNDRLFGGGDADRCLGGNGDDAAAVSTEDEFNSVERFMEA